MRLDIEVGLYNEDIERALKWYSWIKKPSKEDQHTYELFKIFLNDLKRQDKEYEDD